MVQWLIRGMVFLGSLLMVYNIYGFVRFTRYVKKLNSWNANDRILYVPIILLVCFLLGYLAVGMFGKPDMIMAGILFGGSVFVFVIYKLLNGITQRIVEREHLEAELMAAEELHLSVVPKALNFLVPTGSWLLQSEESAEQDTAREAVAEGAEVQ